MREAPNGVPLGWKVWLCLTLGCLVAVETFELCIRSLACGGGKRQMDFLFGIANEFLVFGTLFSDFPNTPSSSGWGGLILAVGSLSS